MGFNPPVPQQDSNWEIRVAVQVSLLLQVFLIFVGPMRKRSSSPFPRFVVWSCYLLADWVADLALGLLLNNMGNIGGGGSSSSSSSFGLKRGGTGATAGNNDASSSSSPIIFAFWTPFLLLHLGGPDTITAYSLEDNELWLRHLIGLLFELFSACVIFFCSLRGNPMIPATVLMFVVGVIKYAERTYSLYSGSVDGFRSNILDPADPGPNYAKLMTEFDSKKKAGISVEITIANGEAKLAHEEMEKHMNTRLLDTRKSVEARAYDFFLIFRRLFVNVILSFKERRLSQAFFVRDTDTEETTTSIREAFEVIEVELNFIYDMVYTKAPVAYTTCGWVLRCICSCCLVAALLIFFFLDKPAHQILPVDVGITYALLLGGLALDAVALLMIFFSNRAKVYLETRTSTPRLRWLASLRQAAKRWQTRRWSGKTSQLNLISHSLSLGKPDRYGKGAALCLWLSKLSCCEDIVDDFVFVRRVRLKKDGDDERRCGHLCRFLRKTLVPKCWCCRSRNEAANTVAESLLLGFLFRGLKDALNKLKVEQEERKKAVQKHRMERAAAAAAGTPEEEEVATQEKDAIAEVCKRRGDGVVKNHIKRIKGTTTDGDARFKVILDSVVRSDFDESLLLWHIATDLCRPRADVPAAEGDATTEAVSVPPTQQKIVEMHGIAETLSEYMLYLLIKQPDMLAATAGIGLLRYRDTRAEAQRFFDSMAAWNPDHEDARRMLLSVNTTQKPAEVKGDRSKSVLFDAVILAKALRELDEELMWEVITGVWGEMLTFAAAKCRGSMHVRQLSRGGELITLVWFLMAHMGLGDMYQIQEGDAKAKLIVKDQ